MEQGETPPSAGKIAAPNIGSQAQARDSHRINHIIFDHKAQGKGRTPIQETRSAMQHGEAGFPCLRGSSGYSILVGVLRIAIQATVPATPRYRSSGVIE